MKKLLFLLCFTAFFACEKESSDDICQEQNVGYITITNQSSNPYDVWIDGKIIGRLPGKQFFSEVEVKAGFRTVSVKQVSGYILYPTEITKNISVVTCQKISFVFP